MSTRKQYEESEIAWQQLDDEQVAYINRIGDILGQVGEDSLEDTATRVMQQLANKKRECDKYRKQVQLGFKHLIETPVLTDEEIQEGYTAFEHIRRALAKAMRQRDDLLSENEQLERENAAQLAELEAIAAVLGTSEGHSSVHCIQQLQKEVAIGKKMEQGRCITLAWEYYKHGPEAIEAAIRDET